MSVFKRISNNFAGRTPVKKRVRFIDVDEIDCIEMYDNKGDIWFSESDEFDFQDRDEKMAQLLQCMNIHEVEIRTGESPLGLEYARKEYEVAIFHRRASSLNAIVETQTRYPNMGKAGKASVAKAYQIASESAMQSAMERAKLVESFVNDHVRTFEPTKRVFEERCQRPSVLGRQLARRSLN